MAVLDAVLDGVVVLDNESRVELLNEEASRILELSLASARAKHIEDLIGSDHMLARIARGVRASGRSTVESGHIAKRHLGDNLILELAASPITNGDGKNLGVVVAIRDRTLQHNLEQDEGERERLDAFGRFAAGIAHEVKNPLAGIRGVAELLASRSTDEKTRQAAKLIVREANRIASLVDDLMVFTHGNSVSFSDTNIHRVLDDVVDLVLGEGTDGVRIERQYDPSIPVLVADPGRLIQVFLNLVRNAQQALNGPGRISIATRMRLRHRLTLPDGTSVPTLRVTVEDDGPGIPPDLLQKVATPLFTTRPGGTGLGLAVARHWVARHDGTLSIDSRVGQGTKVEVALPIRCPKTAVAEAGAGGSGE